MLTKSLCSLVVCGGVLGLGIAGFDGVNSHNNVHEWVGAAICPLTGPETAGSETIAVDASRPDCPGVIACPITGELVCQDRCPLTVGAEGAMHDESPEPERLAIDALRPDCPGQVICPLTGELVCQDRCPLTADVEAPIPDDPLPCCVTVSDLS